MSGQSSTDARYVWTNWTPYSNGSSGYYYRQMWDRVTQTIVQVENLGPDGALLPTYPGQPRTEPEYSLESSTTGGPQPEQQSFQLASSTTWPNPSKQQAAENSTSNLEQTLSNLTIGNQKNPSSNDYAIPSPGKEFSTPNYGYRVQNDPQNFYTIGRCFLIYFPEPMGRSSNKVPTNKTLSTQNRFGVDIHFGFRRMIVVRERNGRGHCVCVSVYTHGGRATTKPGLRVEDYAALYPRGGKPYYLEAEEQKKLRTPIEFVPSNNKRFDYLSRINFGKVVSIEHNSQVQNMGMVEGLSQTRLVDHYEDCQNDVPEVDQKVRRSRKSGANATSFPKEAPQDQLQAAFDQEWTERQSQVGSVAENFPNAADPPAEREWIPDAPASPPKESSKNPIGKNKGKPRKR